MIFSIANVYVVITSCQILFICRFCYFHVTNVNFFFFFQKYDKAYNNVMNLTRNLTEKERHDFLNKHIEDKQHEEVCIGLMVGILSEPNMAQQVRTGHAFQVCL